MGRGKRYAGLGCPQGRFVGYRGVGRNITDAKRQEQERLRMSLTSKNSRAGWCSRRKKRAGVFFFALNCTTAPAPNLAALRINLDMLSQAPPQQRSAPEYEERLRTCAHSSKTPRSACVRSVPSCTPVLDRGGLLAVVRSYAEPFARRTGVQVQVLSMQKCAWLRTWNWRCSVSSRKR